jgi:hypothetical protein
MALKFSSNQLSFDLSYFPIPFAVWIKVPLFLQPIETHLTKRQKRCQFDRLDFS